MAQSLSKQVSLHIAAAPQLYHRLILVVGSQRSGKTTALHELVMEFGWPFININLSLAERLLDLTTRQRALRVARLVDDIVGEHNGDVVLLDNMEMLFHPDLRQDPLRLLQSLSRNRTIVSTWRGTFDGQSLVYGTPDHPEYFRADSPQAVIVQAQLSQLPGAVASSVMENIA